MCNKRKGAGAAVVLFCRGCLNCGIGIAILGHNIFKSSRREKTRDLRQQGWRGKKGQHEDYRSIAGRHHGVVVRTVSAEGRRAAGQCPRHCPSDREAGGGFHQCHVWCRWLRRGQIRRDCGRSGTERCSCHGPLDLRQCDGSFPGKDPGRIAGPGGPQHPGPPRDLPAGMVLEHTEYRHASDLVKKSSPTAISASAVPATPKGIPNRRDWTTISRN